MSKRSLGVVLAVFALITGMTGMASAQSPSSADKVVFTIGTTTDMVSPNPFKATGLSEWWALFLNYDFLFNFDPATLQPTDGIAYYPPEVSANGKTWTFKIRTGVNWSDGQPLTAKDVAFTYNFIFKNHMGIFFPYIGDPASFSAPDDTTFIWKMKTPSTAPVAPPDVPILPEHIWSKYNGKDAQTIKEVSNVPAVGSGPFHLTEWESGRYWTMDANKDYWGGAPHVDQIIFRVYDTPEGLKLALQNGEVDAAEALPPTIFQSLSKDPKVTTNAGPGTQWDMMSFNLVGKGDPALRNKDVRIAIEHSIDKQALVGRVLLGYGTVGQSIITPIFSRWAWQPSGEEVIGYDPGLAKSMLDQAGYKDTNNDGWRETPNGEPWSLQILGISDVTDSVPEAKLIQGWMQAVGIKTSVKVVSTAKAYDLWYAQDFDMYVWYWSGDPDPNFILAGLTTDQCGVWSDGCYSNPTYDKLFVEQNTTTDIAKRQQLVRQMQQIIYADAPTIILTYPDDLQAYRNDLFTGFVTSPQPRGFIFNSWGSTSERSVRPVAASSTEKSGGGGGVPSWVWVLIAVVFMAGLALVLMSRRGKGAQDVE